MIHHLSGDMLASRYDAIVNPVNCVGVMGAGLARQVARKYPGVLRPYRDACAAGLAPGELVAWEAPDGTLILNVPTKRHWREPSRLVDVLESIDRLRRFLNSNVAIRTVAVPALGCGLGGLRWAEVGPLLLDAMDDVVAFSHTDVHIYAPEV